MLPSLGGIGPVSLFPCRYLEKQAKSLDMMLKENNYLPSSYEENITHSLQVYDKLPRIGGIGPTSSFSLKSLKGKKLIWT